MKAGVKQDEVCSGQLWPDDEGREQLWRFYELSQRANNQTLHPARGRRSTRLVRLGPALFGAFWIYWPLTGLI